MDEKTHFPGSSYGGGWGQGVGEAKQSLPAPGARAVEEDTHCRRFSLCEQHMFLLPGIFPVVLSSRFSWR